MAETSKRNVSGSTKVRKSRNELIRAALGVYLKQRNYVAIDKFRKSDLALIQTPKQFMFNKMIEEDLSRVNSFLYSNVLCLSNNPTTVDQQFSKFVQYVQSQRSPIKDELTNLFGPLISHLYIELLKGREWKPACDFLRTYAHLVAPVENLNAPLPNKVNGCSINSNLNHDEQTSNFPVATTQIIFINESTGNPIKDHFKNVIQSLSGCLRIEAFESIEIISLFRSAKYELEVSLATINALKTFMETHGHVTILNILQTWIRFEINDIKDENDDKASFILEEEVEEKHILENGIDSKCDIKAEKVKTLESTKSPGETKSSPEKLQKKLVNTGLRRLRHSAMKLQKLDTVSRNFQITDPEKKLTSASLDPHECHLVAGFDTSVIKIWQLNQNTCRGRNMYRPIRDDLCEWSTNNLSENECSSSDDEVEGVDLDTFTKKLSKRARIDNFMSQKYDGNSFDDSGGISLRGHSKGVTDVLFSKHPLLLSVSKDLTMRAWKASDYTCGAIYRGHNYPIWCVTENPVGMYLATGSRDMTARLWSLDREHPLITYVGHTQDVDCIAFHPNGNYLATGSTDLSVRLWCVTSGKLFRVFTECRLPVSCISFSPDGKLLAAGGDETKIRIFDLAGGSQINELKDHTAPVTSITWNSSGNKFASCCTDGTIRVWDVTKVTVADMQAQSSSSTSNKPLWQMSGSSRSVKVMFNSTDSISCIGSL